MKFVWKLTLALTPFLFTTAAHGASVETRISVLEAQVAYLMFESNALSPAPVSEVTWTCKTSGHSKRGGFMSIEGGGPTEITARSYAYSSCIRLIVPSNIQECLVGIKCRPVH